MSRQREYLADASAVQFTRNPDGLAGALKRIGGVAIGLASCRRRTPPRRATCFSPRACGKDSRGSPRRTRRWTSASGGSTRSGTATFPPAPRDAGGHRRARRRQPPGFVGGGGRAASSCRVAVVEARRRPGGRSHRAASPVRRGAGRRAAAAGEAVGPRAVRRPGGAVRPADRSQAGGPRASSSRGSASWRRPTWSS